MPRDGAMVLGDYPADVRHVHLGCRKCDRRGRYRIDSLVGRYGLDMRLPEMIAHISADCPRRSAAAVTSDHCGAYIENLPT